jgi:hypothetical protein
MQRTRYIVYYQNDITVAHHSRSVAQGMYSSQYNRERQHGDEHKCLYMALAKNATIRLVWLSQNWAYAYAKEGGV